MLEKNLRGWRTHDVGRWTEERLDMYLTASMENIQVGEVTSVATGTRQRLEDHLADQEGKKKFCREASEALYSTQFWRCWRRT